MQRLPARYGHVSSWLDRYRGTMSPEDESHGAGLKLDAHLARKALRDGERLVKKLLDWLPQRKELLEEFHARWLHVRVDRAHEVYGHGIATILDFNQEKTCAHRVASTFANFAEFSGTGGLSNGATESVADRLWSRQRSTNSRGQWSKQWCGRAWCADPESLRSGHIFLESSPSPTKKKKGLNSTSANPAQHHHKHHHQHQHTLQHQPLTSKSKR